MLRRQPLHLPGWHTPTFITNSCVYLYITLSSPTQDLTPSARFPSNPWSYQACATPAYLPYHQEEHHVEAYQPIHHAPAHGAYQANHAYTAPGHTANQPAHHAGAYQPVHHAPAHGSYQANHVHSSAYSGVHSAIQVPHSPYTGAHQDAGMAGIFYLASTTCSLLGPFAVKTAN